MSIFSLIGYTLAELFRKPDNWRQMINKRVRLFIHQTMCLKRVGKKKLLGRHKVAKWLFNYFLKKHRSSHLRCSIKKLFLKTSQYLQKQPPDVFYKKGVLWNFTKFTSKHLCQSFAEDEQRNTCVVVSF